MKTLVVTCQWMRLLEEKILTFTMYCVLVNLKPTEINPRIIAYWNRAFIRNIDSREADVVRLYFGLGDQHPMTLEEIGETFDLTRERVRQVKKKRYPLDWPRVKYLKPT
jgi:hypothetical protein